MITGIAVIVVCGFVAFIWLEIKAGAKAAEHLERAEADNEALKKAAEPITDDERERAARLFQRP